MQKDVKENTETEKFQRQMDKAFQKDVGMNKDIEK